MNNQARWNELIGLFLLSCASLLFQVTATKIFEYSVWANYAYLVISTCMFGMGFSGVLLTRFPRWLKWPERKFLPLAATATGLGVLIGFLAMNTVPIHLPDFPRGVANEMMNVGIVFICLAIPFFFIGLIVSFLFENRGSRANRYYFFDMVGAGLGSFLLVPLIASIEPQGLICLASGLCLAAAATFLLGGRADGRRPRAAWVLLAAVLLLTLWGAPRAADWIDLNVHVEKRSYLADLKAGRVENHGWSALSRVDIAQFDARKKRVWIAGGVNESSIVKFDGDFEAARGRREAMIERARQNLLYHALPHLSKKDHTVCIIGTSGGEDALLALMYGARKVVGIEMDPEIVRFVTETYREYAGGLFTDGDYSEVVVDEGRSYLRRSGRKFDVIQQINNFTPIAFQNGALNLSENYLLTVESFQEFYDKLTDDGILAISRYGVARTLSIAVEMFRRMGLSPEEYSQHLIVVEGPRPVIPTLMVKRSRFTPEEVDAVFHMYSAGGHGRRVLYAPGRTADLPHPGNNIYLALATSPDPAPYWRIGCFDFSPTTDDHPFFNRMKRLGVKDQDRNIPFLPRECQVIPRGKMRGRIPTGDLPPLIILAESALLALVFFGVPLFSKRELRQTLAGNSRALGYFACLGVAFIFIELCLMQRLILFLGAPVYSISTVLGSLLISAGVGSLLSGRIPALQRNVRLLLWTVAAVVLLVGLGIPLITRGALGLSFGGRLAVSILLCSLAGIFMGMPMPTGIRLLTSEQRPGISWCWAINGFFSVVGSALAVLIASVHGFSSIFFIATGLYLVAPFFLMRRAR